MRRSAAAATSISLSSIARAAFPPSFEVLAYPVTPQVHSDDDVSLLETPLAQADTVASARLLAPHASIAVTPITLKPRFNPDAADADGAPAAPNGLPDNVDPRQMALIAAAWTLASVRRLGQAGAGSATYFETVGWRGVLQSDLPEPRDAAFPAAPGMLFPVYHLLAELAPLSGLEMLECNSSHPLELEAIHLATAGELLLLVANLTPRTATAELRADRRRPRDLSPERRHRSPSSPPIPMASRESWNQLRAADGAVVELELSPFEVSVLRWRAVGDPAGG